MDQRRVRTGGGENGKNGSPFREEEEEENKTQRKPPGVKAANGFRYYQLDRDRADPLARGGK